MHLPKNINTRHHLLFDSEWKMVNVTISLPEALKSRMDEHPKVNWSKVCREAIDTYIRILENPIPDIKVELREVRFSYAKGKPGLLLDLAFKNEMKIQLVLDRIFFHVNFIPTPGTTLDLVSSVEVMKRNIPIGRWVMLPFVEVDPDTILRADEQLIQTFQCTIHITAFFKDFQEAYTESRTIKVPIDEWQRFVEHVVKSEKEMMNIRKNRLAKYSV